MDIEEMLVLSISLENYLYPLPEQSFESLKEWLHEIRASDSVKSKWDEEEFILWVKNLWFICWQDAISYLRKHNLEDKMFAWGIGKYWDDNGLCAMAKREIIT